MSSTEEEKGHSKSALKKAEKAKLIAEKKAKAEAEKAEKAAAAASAASAQLEESKSIELVEPTGVSEAVRIRIEHASDSRGKRVRVSGWVHYLRRQGNSLLFVELRDGSSLQHPLLQCVLSGDLAKTYDARTLCREASVEIFGVLMQDDRAKGGVELQADYWRLIGKSSEELENRFNQDSNPDVLLDNRHLHLRSVLESFSLKIRFLKLRLLRLCRLKLKVDQICSNFSILEKMLISLNLLSYISRRRSLLLVDPFVSCLLIVLSYQKPVVTCLSLLT
jgi:asparaginyl-tRNA synthetase